MPRINQLPVASSVAQTDVLAIDTPNKTYQVPRSVLAPSPYIATIPTGQWSGSGSDYYITVTASNVTADSILIPHFDADSEANLQGSVWCVPAAGSFTIHTNTLPSGTVTILVQFIGIMGEAQYQVLADVYSTSQAVAKADIVNNLTSTETQKPLSAAQGKVLEEHIQQSTAHAIQASTGGLQLNSTLMAYKMILLVFRRYGYWDSLAVPVSLITGGTTNAGAFIRFNTNEIKVTINTTGLVELTGAGASDLVVEAYGLF